MVAVKSEMKDNRGFKVNLHFYMADIKSVKRNVIKKYSKHNKLGDSTFASSWVLNINWV